MSVLFVANLDEIAEGCASDQVVLLEWYWHLG